MNQQLISMITRSLLAVVIVIGGGVMLYLDPDTASYVTALMGAVVGYYFGQEVGNAAGQKQVAQEVKRAINGHVKRDGGS